MKNHMKASLDLARQGHVNMALALVKEYHLFDVSGFSQDLLLQIPLDSCTAMTVEAFESAGAEFAGGRCMSTLASAALTGVLWTSQGRCASDDYVLALLKHIDCDRAEFPFLCNLLAFILLGSPSRAPSAKVMAIIRERSGNTAHWNDASGFLRGLFDPQFLVRMIGTKIVIAGKDHTDCLHKVIPIDALGTAAKKTIGSVVAYCRAMGAPVTFLGDWCREMAPRDKYRWLLDLGAPELIAEECPEEAHKSDLDSQRFACAFHGIVQLMEAS